MKVYQVTIRPITGFGTPLKGDTLFGHLCWQIYYDKSILNVDLETLLQDYSTNPFCIISTAFPYIDGRVYLKRPALPLHMLFKLEEDELIKKRKELKASNWFELKIPLSPLNEISYTKIAFERADEQVRCTIHRILGKTTGDSFSPFVVEKKWYLTDLAIFVGLREDLCIDGIIEALDRIGHFGFGKDATAGWGKFKILDCVEINNFTTIGNNFNAYYTLSPAIPEKNIQYAKIFYEPFVRYGRHGDILSVSKNPFKAPILMADEGAIFIPKTFIPKFYLGSAINNVSSVLEKAVAQGYALVIPVEVKDAT